MIVNFFSVRVTVKSSNINELHKSFGVNIPMYLPLEGGSGINYLFCVSSDINNIIKICELHNYKINNFVSKEDEPELSDDLINKMNNYAFTKKDIQYELYNNNYHVTISYCNNENYLLEKND